MNRIKNLLGVFAFSLLVLSLPLVASAQWGGNNRDRDRDRDDDYYGENHNRNCNDISHNHGRDNGYNNNYQLRNTIRRLKNDSKDFEKFVDNALDRSRYDGSDYEDRINDLANAFRKAADRLENKFDNGRDLNRSSREAQDVINLANRLDRELRRVRLGYDIEGYWNNIQRQVREVSNAYRNNRGRGNGRYDDWKNKFPFPF